MRKVFSVLLFVFLVGVLVFAGMICIGEVQAVSKPSVPQFTVKFVDNSYDVPPSTTTTVNPYTGEKNTITTPGYHVTNRTIEVKVPNQSFTQYRDEVGIYVIYTIMFKLRAILVENKTGTPFMVMLVDLVMIREII